MDSSTSSYAPLLLFLSFAFFLLKCQSSPQDLKSYIVYTGSSMRDEASTLSLYTSMLQQVAESNNEPKSVMRHYKRSFSGFVAKLTEEEAHRMAGLDGVISVFPNEKNELHTTRSWDFIGFPLQVERAANASNLIIGVIDTGIWPESESFYDTGFGPPPNKWKGSCQGTNFTCNNKIIGARYYRGNTTLPDGEQRSARDINGHGTHVASIAAGNAVRSASMLGLAQGTARGGATSARIAVYKVCWIDGCWDEDILAAFDDAIADGVDIITVSLGIPSQKYYFKNVISIGSFHAMRNGVLTTASVGNRGPALSTVTNFAPWLISVAASSTSRKFVTRVQLGNNRTYEGISVNSFDLKGEFYRLIYGKDVPAGGAINESISRYCRPGSLNENLSRGNIVLCDEESDGEGPFKARAAGAVTKDNDARRDDPYTLPLPGSYLTSQDGGHVFDYIHSTRTPTATIFKSDETRDTMAPLVVSFSSRGPNPVTQPDLVAPGVTILGAWSPEGPPSGIKGDDRKLLFNIMSGTSVACPHVAGAAAYVKAFHPTWSPAAIRSALMTTAAGIFFAQHNPDLALGYGVGQIDPMKAVNPGLVYDASEIDYVRFLCGQGYSSKELQIITGDSRTCSNFVIYGTARDLNYPSVALQLRPSNATFRYSFRRTVTNVGSPNSTYAANSLRPLGLSMTVDPNILRFSYLGQKLSFVVTLQGILRQSRASASLIWNDIPGNYQVRSTIFMFKE